MGRKVRRLYVSVNIGSYTHEAIRLKERRIWVLEALSSIGTSDMQR